MCATARSGRTSAARVHGSVRFWLFLQNDGTAHGVRQTVRRGLVALVVTAAASQRARQGGGTNVDSNIDGYASSLLELAGEGSGHNKILVGLLSLSYDCRTFFTTRERRAVWLTSDIFKSGILLVGMRDRGL